MDWIEVLKITAPAFFGALGAYMAIREDLAIIKTKQQHHDDELRMLREWRERVTEHKQ